LATEQGLSLIGPDGLLKQFTKTVLETALNEEMTEHLGYEKHDASGGWRGQRRQWRPGRDGAHRGVGAGGDRGAAGSGRVV
jgi:transposase-like protein